MQGKAQKRSPAASCNTGGNKNGSGTQKIGGIKVVNRDQKTESVKYGGQTVKPGGICNNNAGTNFGGNDIEGGTVYYGPKP